MPKRHYPFTSIRTRESQFSPDDGDIPSLSYPPLPFSLSEYSSFDKEFSGSSPYVSAWYICMMNETDRDEFEYAIPKMQRLPPGHIAISECLLDFARFSWGLDSFRITAAVQAYHDFYYRFLGLPSHPAHKAARFFYAGMNIFPLSLSSDDEECKKARKLFRKSIREASRSLHPEHFLLFESLRALIAIHLEEDADRGWEEVIADCETLLKLSLKAFGLTCVPSVIEAFNLYAKCHYHAHFKLSPHGATDPDSLERSEAVLVFLLDFQEKELEGCVDEDTISLLSDIYRETGRSQAQEKLIERFSVSHQIAFDRCRIIGM